VALALIALAWIHFRETPPDERVLRASISLPDDFASLASFALSPDGRFLALALNGAGVRVLWLRALDSQRFQLLNDTTGAQYPFWSPDGRSIGFFAGGKLKTIPTTGGPSQSLCELPNDTSGGGSWNREGVILFSGGFGESGIQRVSANGGACTAITKPEAGTNHRFPEFLPDGKHFLYFVDSGDETKQGVYLSAVDNPSDGRRILTDRSSAVFAPRLSKNKPDHILFLRDNTLMAQPFDATTLQTAGEAFAVTTQASFSVTGTTRQVAASVSGSGLLAYMANRTTDSQLNWIDRSGMDVEKVIARGPQRSITLSPNGKTVVTGRPEGLWLRDLIRGVDSPFTFPPVNGQSSAWSPDGKWIAFSSGGSNGSTLFIKDVSGAGEPVAIFQNSNYKSVSDWSRDGRLLYTEIDPKTKADVWILPDPLRKTKDAMPYKVLGSDFNETMAQFSPDGQWIAYVSDESRQYEVYIQQVSGAGKTKISSKRGTQPRWRSDGRELFYMEAGPRYQWMSVAVQIGPGGTLMLGQPKVLFTRDSFTNAPPANGFVYSPRADGQRFLVNTPSDAPGTLNVITNWEKAASTSKAPE
jgi:Tol biopolymer transport system component